MKKVSIIVPVYNTEKYLSNCIESILNQTYTNIELLLIDDGSVDSSLSICKEYEAKDSRIQVFHQTNSGVSSARNHGLTHSTGDFIMFVDSDDYIHPNMVQNMLSAADEPTKLVLCDYEIVDQYSLDKQNRVLSSTIFPVTRCNSRHEYVELLQKCWTPCCKLYHASILQGISFPNCAIAEDMAFNVETIVSNKEFAVACLNYKFYYYVMHSESAMHNGYNPKFLEGLKYEEHSYEKLKLIEADSYCYEFISSGIKVFFKKYISLSKSDQKAYRNDYLEMRKILFRHLNYLLFNPKQRKKERIIILLIAFFPQIASFIIKE